jgi:hypothetical protein
MGAIMNIKISNLLLRKNKPSSSASRRNTSKNKLKLLAFSLSTLLVMSIFAQGTAQSSSAFEVLPLPKTKSNNPFTDINGNLHKDNIVWAYQHEITTGSPSGSKTYKPDDAVNRGAMASFLRRVVGNPKTTKYVPNFTDIKGNVHEQNIKWLASENITTGSPQYSSTYRPLDLVNRGAMATFMYRIAGEPSYTAPAKSPFIDVPTNHLHYKAICWLKSVGLTTGSPANSKTYKPQDTVNRGSMATFLHREYDKVIESKTLTCSYDQYISDNKCVYKSRVLAKESYYPSNFLGTGASRSDIRSITFSKSAPTSSSCSGKLTDVSALENGSVKACAVYSGGSYSIVVGAKGGVIANSDSSSLFMSLKNLVSFSFANLDTTGITDMEYMFASSTFLADIKSFPAGFGSKATDMSNMFSHTTLPASMTSFPAGFGSQATDMSNMFSSATLPTGMKSFPAGFGSKTTSMSSMFAFATLNANIDWSKTTFSNLYDISMGWMFSSTEWNNHTIKVKNTQTRQEFITSGNAPEAAIKV